MSSIHPTAVIAARAELAAGVVVGPGAIVGEKAVVGRDTIIDAHAQVGPLTTLGERNHLYQGAIVGSDPQDKKYIGEDSYLRVGSDNIFREYCTVNRGTGAADGETSIGDGNLLMAYSHVAHDCHLGNNVVLANAATLAGHIAIDDNAIIGGLTPIHQFVRVGRFAFIGGGGWVNMDVPPYMLYGGTPSRIVGINSVGLERSGLSSETRAQLKQAFKILYRSQLNLSQAIEQIAADVPATAERDTLLQFLRTSQRGIMR